MKPIAQNEIISLISELNAFADNAEQLINATRQKYESDKGLFLSRHKSELADLESAFKKSCDAVSGKSNKTISDARNILAEIDKLDGRLSRADSYYVKTKDKKAEILSDTISTRYANATDYFDALEKISADFNVLYRKYSEDILPGLINGLNYLFSSKRKKEYEELIILKNTVASFVREIEEVLPPLTDENIAALKQDYLSKRETILERQSKELEGFESQYSGSLDSVADQICTNLDNILPDEFVDYLSEIVARYLENQAKVNTSSEVLDGAFDMILVDYPVDFFVQSPIVAAVIKDKCSPLMTNGEIHFPIIISETDAPAWIILNDNSNTTAVHSFMHSVMFGFLSSCPVESLVFRTIDPENRGNSIMPFFDAKKKLPELFGEKILINREDIAGELNRLNEKIENILQDKLGNQYENIYEYARDYEEYELKTELLLLYDFPKGFDERTLSDLRNIIRNGRRCGIFTAISYSPSDESNYSKEYQQNLQAILGLSDVIHQDNQEFIYKGLSVSYFPMPEKSEFAKFFSKYMLIYEGIQNRGIAFSPLIKKLVDLSDLQALDEHIDHISQVMDDYEQTYAKVPALDAGFPNSITLGNVRYPADIFSDSVGYQHILDRFEVPSHATGEQSSFVQLPMTFDLRNSFHLFLNAPEKTQNAMLQFTHHVIWSFLSFMPVTKVNVCVFDAEQRGNSIIPFLDFRKKSPDTFDEKIYTNRDAMVERLQAINTQIDDFIQEKLGNQYKNFLDYNLNTPSRAEPVTLLILYDFPSEMDGRSIDLLTNILRNGSKCGVFTIICYNPAIHYSGYENIEERLEQIQRYCTALDYKDGHYSLLPYNLQIDIPAAPGSTDADQFIADYTERSEAIKKQGLSFRDILSKDLFSKDSSRSLKIPVGVGDGDSIVSITIGEGASHHGLIAGATGSGKSTLLHTLIMSAMLHYGPDQLHLYLMDFKSGTEFKIYESVKLPHIQLLALDAMQEFGESILENLVKEMENRASLFKGDEDNPINQTSLAGYKQATGKSLPRILVIMDEFQILFNDATNRKVANHCAELTKRLVTEGRSFGIHLLMATQSTKIITDLTLSSGVIEQMRIRIGLKCGEYDARYLFSDADQKDTKALTMMKGPIGTAVLNQDFMEESNIGFRAAYCDDKTQRELLQMISEKYADVPSTLQTFEGGRTTKLLDYFEEAGITRTEELPVQIHMGTPIKVNPPFAISIDRKRKHNLLICGANDRMANMIANNYIVSALLNSNTSVYCIDGDKLVGDDGSAAFYRLMGDYSSRLSVAEDRSDIIKFINEVFEKYQSWKKQNDDQVIFFVIKNLQFLDIVKSLLKGERIDESEYLDEVEEEPQEEAPADPNNPFASVLNYFENKSSDSGQPVGDKLLKLISDGSGFGIHFVVTSLEYQTVRENMYYGENVLTKFPERIIFSLGNNDADNLIENVSVSGLRDNTVYFTDGVSNTFQMKPYILPFNQQLQEFLEGEAKWD